MHILSHASHAPARIAAAVAAGLGLLLAVVLVARPEMMGAPMAMAQRLIVGFGL